MSRRSPEGEGGPPSHQLRKSSSAARQEPPHHGGVLVGERPLVTITKAPLRASRYGGARSPPMDWFMLPESTFRFSLGDPPMLAGGHSGRPAPARSRRSAADRSG